MSLGTKIILVLVIMLTLCAGAEQIVERFIIMKRINGHEAELIHADLDRWQFTLQAESDHLASICATWATSDLAYEFIRTGDTSFIESELQDESIRHLNLAYLAFVNRNRQTVWSRSIDPRTGASATIAEFSHDVWRERHPLLTYAYPPAPVTSVMKTSAGTMVVAAHPIIQNSGQGPVNGVLIMAWPFGDEWLGHIRHQARLDVDVWEYGGVGVPTGVSRGVERVLRTGRPHLDRSDPVLAEAYSVVTDLSGEPALILRLRKPRTYLAGSLAAVRAIRAYSVGAGIILVLTLWALLRHVVIRPTLQLTQHVSHLSDGREDVEFEIERRDEIGSLAREFDALYSKLTDSNRRLLYQALHDALTGLPNRADIRNRLRECLERTKRDDDYKFALLFLDLDRFKLINDSLGHDVGDKLLIEIGHRIEQVLRGHRNEWPREEDAVARLGGDEFVVLIAGLRDFANADLIAERLREAIAERLVVQGRDITCQASIGIACNDRAYTRAEEVLRDADIAMYYAKYAGGQGIARFSSRMHARIQRRLELENALRTALSRDQLEVHYQPIIDAKRNAVCGFEALLRWHHPVRGYIRPDEFIAIAEETGLIVPIGEWVLREATRQIAEWNRQFPQRDLSVSVNISKLQMIEGDISDRIGAMADEAGIDPGQLHLEVTESTVAQDIEHLPAAIEGLERLGIELHIDDFGTGQSSLSYLHQSPFTVLKIDRSFVQNLSMGRDYAAVIDAMITLAHNLGMKVTAEGVETEEQLASLIALGCDQVQGFLFSRAVPADQTIHLLALGYGARRTA